MTKEQINEYSVRISQSSKTELVSITCEIINNYISDAVSALKDNDRESFSVFVKRAMSFVDDLSSSLDMKYDISYNLLSLYMYVKRILIHGNAHITDKDFESAVKVMEEIGNAFRVVAANSLCNEKSMENSDKIYAGYTYGKNLKLNEVVVKNI